jgi:hypothetical protein
MPTEEHCSAMGHPCEGTLIYEVAGAVQCAQRPQGTTRRRRNQRLSPSGEPRQGTRHWKPNDGG